VQIDGLVRTLVLGFAIVDITIAIEVHVPVELVGVTVVVFVCLLTQDEIELFE
jgi:hypothetical protein